MPTTGYLNGSTGEMHIHAEDGTELFRYQASYDDCIEKYRMFEQAVRKAEKLAREDERRKYTQHILRYEPALGQMQSVTIGLSLEAHETIALAVTGRRNQNLEDPKVRAEVENWCGKFSS